MFLFDGMFLIDGIFLIDRMFLIDGMFLFDLSLYFIRLTLGSEFREFSSSLAPSSTGSDKVRNGPKYLSVSRVSRGIEDPPIDSTAWRSSWALH